MTLFPIIERELRSSARHAITYYLRVGSVAVLLVVSLWFGLRHGFGPSMGGPLFSSLHLTLFCSIWILVPMMTADCISREKREGTLGLLFMTPLTGPDVVIAKGLAHGLRSISLWISVLPVLTVPFLLGGVGWGEALLSVLINGSAICWALAAGLLASAWNRTWLRAVLWAAIFAIGFFLLFLALTGSGVLTLMSPGRAGPLWPNQKLGYKLLLGLGFATNAGSISGWSAFVRLVSSAKLVWAMIQVMVESVFGLWVVIWLAGRKTRHSWQEEPPSARQVLLEKTFCTPILCLAFFRRWMRGKLERNPVGWLEQRTWSARLVTWGWLAIIISLYSAILNNRTSFFRTYGDMQYWLAWLLVSSMAVTAAGSFRRERETGVLELLLVSPLPVREIVAGRLTGLWSQFLPAFALLLGVWAYLQSLVPQDGNAEVIAFFALTFLTLPVVGLYFSLACRNFTSAFLATITIGPLASFSLPWFFNRLAFSGSNGALPLSGSTVLFQLTTPIVCWFLLCDALRSRSFRWDKMEAR